MLWHGRPNGCGLNLPEEKKLIFGVEGGNIVAYGQPCLPPLHEYKPGICRGGVRFIQFKGTEFLSQTQFF